MMIQFPESVFKEYFTEGKQKLPESELFKDRPHK